MDRSLPAEKNRFTIGELAREFGVTHRTLRFYEDKALITPQRQGQRRLYSRRDRARLKLILQGKRVGFSLKEIGEMLDLYDLRDGQITQLRVSLVRFDERIGALERQRADIDEALEDLRKARQLAASQLAIREKEAGRPCRKGDKQP